MLNVTRRRVMQVGSLLVGASVAGLRAGAAVAGGAPSKRVTLRNLHTGERRELVYIQGDAYVPEALADAETLLRDYRNGERHPIDPKLLDYLHDVAALLGVDPVFSVISGYRSPQTNETLRERSSGVAEHSLHMEGRAIDVRLAKVDCATLAARARELSRGGVGYYRHSDFVHLDTGAYRTWQG